MGPGGFRRGPLSHSVACATSCVRAQSEGSVEKSKTQDSTNSSDAEAAKENKPSWGSSDLLTTFVAGVAGAVVALVLGILLAPTVTITTTVGLLTGCLLALRCQYPRFAGMSGLYFFATSAAFVVFSSSLPGAYIEDATAAMLTFGVLVLTIVGLRELGQLVLRKLFGDKADAIIAAWRAVTAAIGLALTLLAAEKLWRKAARYGGIGVGGPTFAALDILGFEWPAPLFWVDGVNAVVIGFVGIAAAAMFTLDTLYAVWHVAKYGAKTTAKAGQKGANVTKSAAGKPSEYVDEARSDT